MKLRAEALGLMVAWPFIIVGLNVWVAWESWRFRWEREYVSANWRSTYRVLWHALRTGQKKLDP